MKKIKVAIYSGVIPTTTFIENLITAVADNNIEVLLFGEGRQQVNYKNSSIRVYKRPTSNWLSVPSVTFNILRLRLLHNERYRTIKKHIDNSNPHKKLRFALWQMYLPMLFHMPDIFHVQWVITCEEWMFLKDLFNVKIIVSLRGAQINYKPLADPLVAQTYKKVFPQIDGFHAVSKNIANEALKYGAPSDKIRVIYSGVNFEMLSKYQKSKYTSGNEQLNIISVGRMHWKKGYHFALDVIKKLINEGVKIHYTIIAGLNAEEILYQVHDLNLENHITLYKNLPQPKVFELMSNSDLLLLPSFEEGIANVVLEAMAIGLPVLSSDACGMTEVIFHKETGYLYQNRNGHDLAHQLKQFINASIESKIKISENAKSYVNKNHRLEDLGLNMSNFYQDIYNSRL